LKLDEFNDHLERRKLSRFDNLMLDGLSPVMALNYEEFYDGNCTVCKSNAADAGAMSGFESDFNKKIAICKNCYSLIRMIGGKLPDPNNKYILFGRSDRKKNAIPLFGGLSLEFAREVRQSDSSALEITNIRNRGSFAFQAIAGHLPMVNNDDMVRWGEEGLLREENGEISYLGDIVKKGMPKSFHVLAGESRESIENKSGRKEIRGKAFLGAFKADVDNLGFIFSIGLNDRLSISRFAGMSRMLNHFFADYLVDKISREFRDVYVVFAGGDDMFLIGPWTKMVEFAALVQKEFSRFVAGNPEVTISAGLAVTKPGLPVQGIASLVEELLEQSKKRESKEKEKLKNAVTLFDTTVGWGHFEELLETADWLERLVVDGKVTAGLARRLMQYSDDFLAFKSGDIARGIYLSHMSYDFVRNVDEEKLTEAERIRFLGIKNDEFLLENMRLPLSCALYKLRSDK
jgi:CRISPR-associated protein Csm1